MKRLLVAALALTAGGTAVSAADLRPQDATPLPPLPRSAPSFISEVRFGVTAQDPTGPESGSANLIGEILSVRPFAAADPVLNSLIPRIHVGGSLNLAGNTSFGYAGLTWTFDITPAIFVEGSLGGAVHNGETDPIDDHHNALGCTALFRESGSVGMRVTENWTVMATVEHLSNAGLCSNNRGLTNFGLKVGYAF
ncbi:acyloxyacyl hydrolase [Microvirga sp. TS319]|uniref:acyloxyacyl hydrolase n=1 Tax=Microvirga sp. TS319 TaxID=3241165 RepID=UPI00351A56E9